MQIIKSGERGIRTPGPVKDNGFQDRRFRPLSHLSLFIEKTATPGRLRILHALQHFISISSTIALKKIELINSNVNV